MSSLPIRTIVVGDLHGGLKALRECLVSSMYNQSKDRLIFLGNYVGGLPESAEMIEALIWLEHTSVHKPVFLMGNNDKWCSLWLKSGNSSLYWLKNGGTNTVKSYIRSPNLLSTKHTEFFQKLKTYFVDEENRAFVNAGFIDSRGLGYERNSYNYFFTREFWQGSLMNPRHFEISKRGIPVKFRSYVYNQVFVGNIPTTDSTYTVYNPETKDHTGSKIGEPITKPMKRRNIWNVNTGVAQGHSLTMMDVESKMIWQSRPSREIYIKKEL